MLPISLECVVYFVQHQYIFNGIRNSDVSIHGQETNHIEIDCGLDGAALIFGSDEIAPRP